MDDELSYCLHSLKVDGTLVAQRGMPPGEVVKAFDVIKDVGACLVAGVVLAPVTSLDRHRGEEAFHHGVVPDIPRAAHAARDAELREHALELLAAVLGGFNRSSQHLMSEVDDVKNRQAQIESFDTK